MRILHVTDGYRPMLGGIELFVEDLARRQADLGHEVAVLTTTEEAAEVAAAADLAPVRVVRTPLSVRHPLAPAEARRTALVGGYDVVHAHLSVVSRFATSVARLTDAAGMATVSTVHSMWASRRPFVQAVRLLADWDRSDLAWTAVSRAAAEEAGVILRPGTDVRVVPNAVDVNWWRARHDVPGARDALTLVTVMRIAPRKRPLALLAILEALRARVPADMPLRAVVIGDGPLERRMRAEVAARQLDGWVTMLGRRNREEIRDAYAAADVYVAPAYEESFGIAALEARAAGLPVVAMQRGGVGEFVAHGVEGLLCRDDADMAASLTRLAIDPGRRSAIVTHNLTHRPAQDWAGTLAGYDEVYRAARRARRPLERLVDLP